MRPILFNWLSSFCGSPSPTKLDITPSVTGIATKITACQRAPQRVCIISCDDARTGPWRRIARPVYTSKSFDLLHKRHLPRRWITFTWIRRRKKSDKLFWPIFCLLSSVVTRGPAAALPGGTPQFSAACYFVSGQARSCIASHAKTNPPPPATPIRALSSSRLAILS